MGLLPAAPHHLSERFSKVLRQERVQEGIEATVQIGQDVTEDLDRHGDGGRIVEP